MAVRANLPIATVLLGVAPAVYLGAGFAALAFFLGAHFGALVSLLAAPAAYAMHRSRDAKMTRGRDRERHIAEMEALHLRAIEGLAMAIEAKDQDTHDHLLRVRVYATEIGHALRLSEDEMQAVKTAALLHDIGKLAVPERIINKPGKLSPEEFEKMKIHPVVGADILERVRFPYPVVPIVRSHHEWWNGMGYPDGLCGEAIPIGARILTAVDCFDAMASDRPYRRAMPLAEAMGAVKKLAGAQFDPRVVEVLEERYVALEERARLEGRKLLRLDTQISISCGVAPGAGFEQDSGDIERQKRSHCALKMAPDEQAEQALREADRMMEAVALAVQSLVSLAEPGPRQLRSDDALAILAVRLAALLPFDCLVLYLREGEELRPWRMGKPAALFFSPAAIALGEGISGWAALHEHGIVNGNPAVEPNRHAQAAGSQELRSALSLPLRDPKERVFGVLSFYAFNANAFSRHHLNALEAVEASIALALKNSIEAESGAAAGGEPPAAGAPTANGARQAPKSVPIFADSFLPDEGAASRPFSRP